MSFRVIEKENFKVVQAPGYNHIFDKTTGYCQRWGDTKEEDPQCAPAPELLDIEISTTVSKAEAERYAADPRFIVTNEGCNGRGCYFCYKGNNRYEHTVSMSYSMYRVLFRKLPKTVCQIAFGITSIYANPDMWKIFQFTRDNGVIPNVTINGVDITDTDIENLKKLCGAVAVSVNGVNRRTALDCVSRLLEAGLKQVNIHYVVHQDSVDFFYALIETLINPDFDGFGAVVLLTGKDKQGTGIRPVSVDQYRMMLDHAQAHGIKIGFDSCGCGLYLKCIKDHPQFVCLSQYAEPCESGLFSFYINTFGMGSVCSFAEGMTKDWDVLGCTDFMSQIWDSDQMQEWRKLLLDNKRNCPLYRIG